MGKQKHNVQKRISAAYFQNENVGGVPCEQRFLQAGRWRNHCSQGMGGATVNNEGIRMTQPSVSLSVQDRTVIQQTF